MLKSREITTDDILTGELDSYIVDMWVYIESEMQKLTISGQTWEDAFFGWEDSSISIMRERCNFSYDVITNLVYGKFFSTRPCDANRFAGKCGDKYRAEHYIKLSEKQSELIELSKEVLRVQRSNAGGKSKDKEAFSVVLEAWKKKPEKELIKAFILEMMDRTDKSKSTIKRYLKEIREK